MAPLGSVLAANGHLDLIANGHVKGPDQERAVHDLRVYFLVLHHQLFQLFELGEGLHLIEHFDIAHCRPQHFYHALPGKGVEYRHHVLAQLSGKAKVGREISVQQFGNRCHGLDGVEGFEGFLKLQVVDLKPEVEFRVRQVFGVVSCRWW